MKNRWIRIFLGVVLGFLGLASAQERHRFEGKTLTGYEYNYFKSPEVLQIGDSLLNAADLIASSSYQDAVLDYHYRFRRKGHRIRFRITPEARLFHERPADSYWQLNSGVKYDYRLGKNTKILADFRFQRMDREGLNGAQDVLVNPLGYTLFGGSAGLSFALAQNNKSELEVFYNDKNFDTFGSRDLEYKETGMRFKTSQEFRPGRYEHKIGGSVYYKQRLYQTLNTAEEPAQGRRDWWYFKSVIFYELPLGGYFNLEPEFTYYRRIDRLEGRSGFQQLGPGLRLDFQTEKTRIRAGFKWQQREYNEIEAADEEGEGYAPLEYRYLDYSLNFEHQLPFKGLFFIGKGFSRIRETNTLSLSSRSFRGYRTYYAGIGLLWKP